MPSVQHNGEPVRTPRSSLVEPRLPSYAPDAARDDDNAAHEPDAASRLFAAEVMLDRLDDLRRHVPHLHHSQDTVHVHQTRVASRRLRTALNLFEPCFSSRQVRRWQRGIRDLTRALGDARDLDVRLGFLSKPISGLTAKEHRAGLERLHLRLSQKRRRAQKALRKGVKAYERSGIGEELDQVLRETITRDRLTEAGNNRPWLLERARLRIGELLEAMLCYEPCIEQPERVTELHQMRIAAKHLRYAMEIFSPLYGCSLARSLESVRNVQKLLGDLHDCDVWLEFLPRLRKKELRRTKRYFGHTRGFKRIAAGIEALERNRRHARAEIHASFVQTWHSSCQDELWSELRTTLQSGGPRVV